MRRLSGRSKPWNEHQASSINTAKNSISATGERNATGGVPDTAAGPSCCPETSRIKGP
jgi:hypothetical protein